MSYVKASLKNYDQLKKELRNLRKAPEKVINATMGEFKSRMPGWIAQEVAKEYNISARKFSSGSIGTVKVKGNDMEAAILFAGRSLTPLHFAMDPKTKRRAVKLSKKDRKKVPGEGIGFKSKASKVATISRAPKPYTIQWQVKRNKTEDAHGDYNTPWFLAPVKKGSSTVLPFQRSPGHPKGFAMVTKKVVSMPQMVSHDGKTLKEEIAKEVWPKLEKRFDHHLERFLGE